MNSSNNTLERKRKMEKQTPSRLKNYYEAKSTDVSYPSEYVEKILETTHTYATQIDIEKIQQLFIQVCTYASQKRMEKDGAEAELQWVRENIDKAEAHLFEKSQKLEAEVMARCRLEKKLEAYKAHLENMENLIDSALDPA